MNKLWGGRFENQLDYDIEIYLNSFYIDKYLFNYEIKVISAHVKSLYLCNYIKLNEKKQILNSLFLIKNNFRKLNVEDIHSYLELELIKYNGDLGKKIYIGKSRNDQITTLNKLMLLDEIEKINILLIFIRKTIINLAEIEFNTPVPGFTHLQIAQPITLGHYLLSWNEMLKRDHINLLNCKKNTNFCPLGSAALAGHNYKINRNIVKKILNFKYLTENSIDAVSDRDYVILFSQFCNILIIHLSRICEDMIIWSSNKFNFLKLSDKISSGSSIMPQKKNPDLFELIRSKSGRIMGNSVNILTILKSQALSYNKDNQEDKESLFDNIYTIKNTLNCFRKCILVLKFNKKNMYLSTLKNYSTATDMADYLVKKGLTFRDSHKIVGNCIKYCENNDINFFNISLKELKIICNLFENDIFYFLSIEGSIKNKNTYGSTSPNQVLNSIQRAKFFLNNIILKFK
ncbi:argininosuccinate lyase [Candidatus Carsonella ruddii]|uniref:Argininosuccinate lyase n=1 Tax=Carsonella ruddii TaxID=114186 RepID=A0A2K8K987_CARRU|nr:argininosuccinate lyase [Candidatus Carsonella ruddii]ATX33423.1 argininosuccinate lyase [Candidatus Carsonella ruddii]